MGPTRCAIAAVTAVFAVFGGSAGTAGADPPTPPPKTTMDHDGTYFVGTDVVPGMYSSAGPVQGGTCYWKRMSSLDGSGIIDNAMSSKPQVVQIDPSDKAFKTNGCQPWQQTDAVSADGKPSGALGALIAQAQLHAYLNDLNARAGRVTGEQLPQP